MLYGYCEVDKPSVSQIFMMINSNIDVVQLPGCRESVTMYEEKKKFAMKLALLILHVSAEIETGIL